MTRLTEHEIVHLLVALAVILGSARILGELARRFHQPAVLGELIAGILLGPTLLGRVLPELAGDIFPRVGSQAIALDALRTISIVLFMLVAGMEVDLTAIRRQGKTASVVSLSGILAPLATGFAAAWVFPHWLGREPGSNHFVFAAFIATAMAISALPVIARTLLDLDLYRSDMGMVVMAAAIFDDLIGWLLFAVILGAAPVAAVESQHGAGTTIALTLGFVLAMITAGRWLIHWILPWIHAHTTWPGGFLGLAFTLALLAAACSTWIGIHPIFGALLCGIALGDSSHVREHTKKVIGQFVSFFFAPLFFATIGLNVDFVRHFDARIVFSVLVIAVFGKVIGCGLGARWAGVGRREAWSIGFCLSARGAMEIVVGLLALQSGLIGERLFVALVIMALVTSMMSGPVVSRLLRRERPRRLVDHLPQRAFLNPLRAEDAFEAIQQLCLAVSPATKLDPQALQKAVWTRERMMSTGMSDGIAVPHARISGLTEPLVAVGLSRGGVDFNARDGQPAHIICLLLTPQEDDGAQLTLLADVARTFKSEQVRQQVLQATGYTEFRAILNTSGQ